MLFKTINELRAIFPVPISDDFNNIKPFIEQAENDYIIPAVSQTQYDDLNSAYNTGTPNAAQSALLAKIQATLALYTYYLWIPSGQLQISDAGIRIATTDTHKTAFQWQIDNLQKSVIRQAGSAMETLLAFMEANISDYSLWAASDSYTIFKESFITSSKEFTKHYSALRNSRLLFLAIRSHIKRVEDTIIPGTIGTEFFDELKTQYLGNTLSADNAKVIPYLQKAIANLSMASAFTTLVVTIDETGVLNLNNTGNREALNAKQPAQPAMVTKLEVQAKDDGQTYLKLLQDFLKTNIANYATYAASSAYDAESTGNEFKNDEDNTYAFMG